MSKFIGEMSYEDFIDALKIICAKEESDKESEKLTVKEKLQNGFKEFADGVKYLVTFEFVKDCIAYLKYIFSKKFIADLKEKFNASEEEKDEGPLTKERFITEGKKFKAAFLDILDTVFFVVVMVILIRFFIGEIRWIPSGSMHPTLLEGDRIFVERYSRFYKTPQRGDIMVFYPPEEPLKKTPIKIFARLTGFFCKDIAYIKRVVGLPGEKFELVPDEKSTDIFLTPNGRRKYTVYINDKPLDEPYIQSAYEYPICVEGMTCGPVVIPEGHYLMLGDNRGNSKDSRYWGFLPQERFIGKAVYLFWPFKRATSLKLNKGQ